MLLFNLWFIHNCCAGNKLHAIKPDVGKYQYKGSLFRRDAVVIIRLRIKVANCPVFPGKSRILGSVSRIPGYTFP